MKNGTLYYQFTKNEKDEVNKLYVSLDKFRVEKREKAVIYSTIGFNNPEYMIMDWHKTQKEYVRLIGIRENFEVKEIAV